MIKLLDERGFLEAPGFVLLLLLSLLLGVHAFIWQKRLSRIREHHRQVLCLKQAIGVTSQMVRRVNAVNKMLAAGKVGQSLALFFPGLGWLGALKWEKAKKILMGLQEAAWLSAQRRLLQQRKAGCHLPYQTHLTPYKHGLTFERQMDLTVLRKEKETWFVRTPLMNFVAQWSMRNGLSPKLHWEIQ